MIQIDVSCIDDKVKEFAENIYDTKKCKLGNDNYFIDTLYGKIKKDLRKLIADTVGVLLYL